MVRTTPFESTLWTSADGGTASVIVWFSFVSVRFDG